MTNKKWIEMDNVHYLNQDILMPNDKKKGKQPLSYKIKESKKIINSNVTIPILISISIC